MSLDNIITLAGRFQSHIELQDFCNGQYKTIVAQKLLIDKLQDEIVHLKELLSGTVPLLDAPVVRIVVPTEQRIAEMEIEKLEALSLERALTLEEVKRLDILTKTKYLAREKNTATIDQPKNDFSEAQLVELAKSDMEPVENEP